MPLTPKETRERAKRKMRRRGHNASGQPMPQRVKDWFAKQRELNRGTYHNPNGKRQWHSDQRLPDKDYAYITVLIDMHEFCEHFEVPFREAMKDAVQEFMLMRQWPLSEQAKPHPEQLRFAFAA